MTDPYATPQSFLNSDANDDQIRRRRKFWLRARRISIAGVIIPPIIGALGSVVGMAAAFGKLSNSGGSDPEALAGNVSFTLHTTMWGLSISAIAVIVLIAVSIRLYTLPKLARNSPQNSS